MSKKQVKRNLTSDNKKCACFYSDEDIIERACRVNLFHSGFGKGFILFGILSLEQRSQQRQQSPQIRSDWQVTGDITSIALLWIMCEYLAQWFWSSFIHTRDFDATRYMTLCLVFVTICVFLFIYRFDKAAHKTTILCNAHSPTSLRSCRTTISLLFYSVSLCVWTIYLIPWIGQKRPTLTCGLIMILLKTSMTAFMYGLFDHVPSLNVV